MKDRASRSNGGAKNAAPALFEPAAGRGARREKDKSLETWIWDAACSIRGAQEAPKFKDFILPLIFTNRLCDVFDDELNRIAELAFDSDEINAIVKDLGLLKVLFKNKMQQKAPQYLKLITHGFNDKDVDNLIEHFRDKDRRKEFFKEFKELKMLYEIISPDAFLRPYIEDYTSLASIYAVVAKAYTKTVYVDKAFQRKTNDLVQKHVTSSPIAAVTDFVAIDENTIDLIKEKHGGDDTKVINLIKSIEKTAEEESGDPFLIAMADRAKQVQESYEDRQASTQEALDELFAEIRKNEQRKREQAEKGYDSLRYFVLTSLQEAGVNNPEKVSEKVARAFVEHPNWRQSEADLRELRKAATFAVYAEMDDPDQVASIVEKLLGTLVSSAGGVR